LSDRRAKKKDNSRANKGIWLSWDASRHHDAVGMMGRKIVDPGKSPHRKAPNDLILERMGLVREEPKEAPDSFNVAVLKATGKYTPPKEPEPGPGPEPEYDPTLTWSSTIQEAIKGTALEGAQPGKFKKKEDDNYDEE